MNSASCLGLSVALVTGMFLSMPSRSAGEESVARQQNKEDPKLGKIRSMAESQHEIVMILMRQGEFAKAALEAGKIFNMGWPADQEPLLVKEILGLSGQFTRHQQLPLALELLENNMKTFKDPKSHVAIYKEMGYVSKEMGQDDKALEYFKKAHDLESKGVKPR